jgi:hypothetical protein
VASSGPAARTVKIKAGIIHEVVRLDLTGSL